MMRKILSIFMVAALALGLLAGCGGGKTASEAPSATPASEPAPTSAAPATEAPVPNAGTIKIGILGPQTGPVAQYGIAVKNGAVLYLDQLNAAGGINGKQIEYIIYDEEGDSAKAVTGYNSLVDQGVVAILGDVTTQPTVAVVAESAKDNMPMITASATATSVTYDAETDTVHTNVFRSCFIDPFQGVTMANFAAEQLNAKTAAVLYDNGDTYSTGVYQYFVEQCAKVGIEVVAEESYASGSVDFSGQLTNIASKNPDILFLPIYYNDVALVATQAAAAGLKAKMLGVDGWASVLDVVTDPALIEGAYYCSGYSPEDTSELVVKFLADYKEVYGEEPNMFGAQGYDAAAILCDAIAAAEKSGKEYGSADYLQAIIDAMKATDKEYVTGHVTYDDHNDPQKTAAIINIKDGKEVFWGKY